jgi:single-strand DNA-binding protein
MFIGNLVGNLGRDAELRYTPQGTPVCDFSVASTEKGYNGREDTTTWVRVSIWGKLGETLKEYLKKGQQVAVSGKVQLREYTDRDGNKRSSLELKANEVQLVGRRDQAQSAAAGSTGEGSGDDGGVVDDETPF